MRPRLTFANVTSMLALFVALGGTSYAVANIGGDDIVNNSVTGKDLKNNSVKATDIAGLGSVVTVRAGNTATGSPFASSQANCNKGETALGGGFGTAGGGQLPSTLFNQPVGPTTGPPTGWLATVALQNPAGATISVTPYVICAS